MEKEFVSGLYPKQKHEKTPAFVLSRGSINLKQMIEFCTKKIKEGEEWINYDVLQPKDTSKKPYAVINTWKPDPEKTKQSTITTNNQEEETINVDEIFF